MTLTHATIVTTGLFASNSGFDQDLSGWDTSGVVDMALLFSSATSFSGGGIGNWDVSGVVDLSNM